MQNKICLITGATSGIGQAAASALAKMGLTVIVVGRSEGRCQNTVAHIQRETGNFHVDYLLADLSVQAQVRQLAADFKARYKRLDVLVNDAGAIFLRRQLSADGIEMNFALNHLAYFLLTNLLLDTLKASAPARVVNVASNSHRNAHLYFENLHGMRLQPDARLRTFQAGQPVLHLRTCSTTGQHGRDGQRHAPWIRAHQHGCQQRLVGQTVPAADPSQLADSRQGASTAVTSPLPRTWKLSPVNISSASEKSLLTLSPTTKRLRGNCGR